MKIANTEFKNIINSKGGLFDVTNPTMEANIGKIVCFINPDCLIQYRDDLVIEGIQKNYKGDVVYRLTYPGDRFGFPVSPEKIKINQKSTKS